MGDQPDTEHHRHSRQQALVDHRGPEQLEKPRVQKDRAWRDGGKEVAVWHLP